MANKNDEKENNIYIKILEYGQEHMAGFTYEEIKTALTIKNDSWEDKLIKGYMHNAVKSGGKENKEIHLDGSRTYRTQNEWESMPQLDSIFWVIDKSDEYSKDIYLWKYTLRYDAYSNYIDYLELQFARKNAEAANRNAEESKVLANKSIELTNISIKISIVAIVISAILAGASIWIQLKNSVKIDDKQLDKITSIGDTVASKYIKQESTNNKKQEEQVNKIVSELQKFQGINKTKSKDKR